MFRVWFVRITRAEWFIILELHARTAKWVIRFEVRSLLSCGYFLKHSHLSILAKLHCPKSDQIRESNNYYLKKHVHMHTHTHSPQGNSRFSRFIKVIHETAGWGDTWHVSKPHTVYIIMVWLLHILANDHACMKVFKGWYGVSVCTFNSPLALQCSNDS